MAQPKLQIRLVANFLYHLHNNGDNTNTKTLNGEINIDGKSDGHRLLQSHIVFCSQISRTDISECRARDVGVKTEHCRRHIFLSAAHSITDHQTHLRVAQVWDVLHLCASLKSSTRNLFHRPLLDVPDPFPSFCSTPSPTTPTSMHRLESGDLPAPLRTEDCSLAVWSNPLLSQFVKIWRS